MGQADNLLELTRLNSDVANSADFATILSRNAVSATADGLAFRGGQFSANVKSSLVILHEFGHNFGGWHSMNNKNNDPTKGYAFGYQYNVAGNKFGTYLSYNHHLNRVNYYSNPRINHPIFGVPMGHENANDMSRYITEERFSLNRGDESRACYTCNAYSGERFYRNIYILLLLGDTNEYTLIIDNVLSLYNYSIQISLSPWLERI